MPQRHVFLVMKRCSENRLKVLVSIKASSKKHASQLCTFLGGLGEPRYNKKQTRREQEYTSARPFLLVDVTNGRITFFRIGFFSERKKTRTYATTWLSMDREGARRGERKSFENNRAHLFPEDTQGGSI